MPTQNARISGLSATKGAQPGQWAACLELPAAQDGYFAIFYDDGVVTDLRRAVGIDGCTRSRVYTLLPPAIKPKPAKLGKKAKK